MENEIKPKVSVCVVCYNQEKYIAQCLQSLVDQVTDFPFEIIVSDDASTDATPQIVQEFASKYPHIVRPILHKKNIGAYDNFKFVHQQPKADYIAHMDGDDYALPGKLQAQAEFLDHNKECNIVFHRMDTLSLDGELIKNKKQSFYGQHFYKKDIIEFVAIGANSSKMYRANCRLKEFPSFDMVDYTINVLEVGDGYASYCSRDTLGVYRQGVGIAGSPSVNKSVLKSLEYFLTNFRQYKNEINAATWAWTISNFRHKKNTKWQFLKLAIKSFSLEGLCSYAMSINKRKNLG